MRDDAEAAESRDILHHVSGFPAEAVRRTPKPECQVMTAGRADLQRVDHEHSGSVGRSVRFARAVAMRVRTVAKARRPDIVLSAAVYPDSSEASSARLQDWRSWLEHRLIDVVCPMPGI